MPPISSHSSRRRFLQHAAATLAATQLPHAALAAAHANAEPGASLQAAPLGSVRLDPASDLGRRTQQNFARLKDPIYRPPEVFTQTNWKSWPGDFEGRAWLALTLLSQSTGQVPDFLPVEPQAYHQHLNAEGYFGPLLDRSAINEQQLSGHGWYLRALCEWYAYETDPGLRDRTLAQISLIIHNLALPLRGAYATYPIDPALRAKASAPANPGAIDGHLDSHHGDWAVSSDTGCAFIFLDGLVQAWDLLRDAGNPAAAPLKDLIDEAIARFTETDLVAMKAQTHASLTGLRALLRVYVTTNDPLLLDTVRNRYTLYRTTAMTEHYANTNWFGRPDSWTEPCAIIDSFMVATQLWQHTANPVYLEDAHRIWFNGIGRGLRANGGFGTDTCPGKSPFVRVRSYEAYFCCTMRGGEGHARAAQYLYFTRNAGVKAIGLQARRDSTARTFEITVPFFSSSTVELPVAGGGNAPPSTFTLRQQTEYPYRGAVTLEFLTTAPAPVMLRLFAPSWSSNHRLTLNSKPVTHTTQDGFLVLHLTAKAGDVLTLNQELHVGPRDAISSFAPAGSYAFEAGPLLLAYQPAQDPAATLRSPDPAPITLPRNATFTPTGTAGTYRVGGAGSGPAITLGPINDLNTTPDPNPRLPHPRQVLFSDS